MREGTKRAYESRIKVLEGLLDKAEDRSSRWYDRMKEGERRYDRLLSERRQGERQRQWALEQALMTNRPDVVGTAIQIANYVYGEDPEVMK